MSFEPWIVYSWSVVVLCLKFLATITVQARERLGSRTFRHPEDASQWHGVVGTDSELCQRAERVLRNDAENHPYYLALGGLLLFADPTSRVTPFYFVGYTISRVVHGLWLLVPRQPHRNYVFRVAILTLLCMAVHLAWATSR